MKRGAMAMMMLSLFMALAFVGVVLGADVYESGGTLPLENMSRLHENHSRTGFRYLNSSFLGQYDDVDFTDKKIDAITDKFIGYMYLTSCEFVDWGIKIGYDLKVPALYVAIGGMLLYVFFFWGFKLILLPVVIAIVVYGMFKRWYYQHPKDGGKR